MTAESLALSGRIVIVGAGVAGLTTALALAPRPVVVLSRAPLGAEGSTLLAQGGMAAALGPDDSCALHAADTLPPATGSAIRGSSNSSPAPRPARSKTSPASACASTGL